MGAEDQFGEVKANIDVCCPKCKSRNAILETDRGYFWVSKCYDCGYERSEENV